MDRSADGPAAEVRLGDRLRGTGATLATAESCTGGLVASLITDVPGSSDYFDRGVVTYAYDAKRELLGVTREALDEHGAVSEQVAKQMARRVRDVSGTTWGLSVTGIAGPGGGTEEKPVGTVYLGVAYAGDWGSGASYADVRHRVYDGDRTDVKGKAARGALAFLVESVEGDATSGSSTGRS